jgi:hypothetical protein
MSAIDRKRRSHRAYRRFQASDFDSGFISVATAFSPTSFEKRQ